MGIIVKEIIACLFCFFTFSSKNDKMKLYENLHPFSVEVNVAQFGAKGDGKTDDTESIQKAIDYARLNNKSTVVFSAGRYRLSKGSITVKQGVLLKGIDKMPAKSGFGSDICQFEISIGKGSVTTPAFIMESFSGITGFSFLYPEQSLSANVPAKYGWTITTNGKASQDGITLRNLMLTNPYMGIKIDNGGQHILENIYGQPIKTGIFIDRQYDVVKINNIHFWPFYSQPGQLLFKWIQLNGDALVINRTDGLQGTNWFAYGYNRGLHLDDQGNGKPWLTLNNILFDVCNNPIVIDALNQLTLNNVTLTGSDVAVSQNGITISETVKDINAIIQINGLTTINFINSCHNKGICTALISMKSKKYDGKNNGVRWYDIINENDSALLNVTIPFLPGNDYRRISGKMQINGFFTYQNLFEINTKDFANIGKWNDSGQKVTPIKDGARFNLKGDISVVSSLLPSDILANPGVYLLELTIKEYSNTGALGLALFYPRIRDYSRKIDYSITPYIADPYFKLNTVLKIPFVIDGGSLNLDFVFGRATNSEIAYIDVTNIKLYRVLGMQTNYKEVMPKYQGLH